jgi:RNA polymerase sigma-70 factor (ECF subfamily)
MNAPDPKLDAELVARVLDDDQDAFADLVRRHHPAIHGLCLSMLGSAVEADDAAQDAFLKAYRSLSRFRGESTFGSWLYRVAANVCLDRLRRRKREKTDSWEGLVEERGDDIERLMPSTPDGSAALEDKDLVDRVLGCLSPEHRLILTLREVQGLDYRELTQTLDCSLDAVKSRLKRARQSFEEQLRHFLKAGGVQ